jgi:3-oxoadipate enol-lactonase
MSLPRVLFLHAFPLDCRMWASQREAVEAAGYAVSLPDLPGPEAEPTMSDWAQRVLRLFDDRLIAVGNSMGGYLAFALWRQARARFAALVLCNTRAGADTEEGRRARDDNIRLLQEDGVPALWERMAPKLFSRNAPPDVVAGAREIALEQGATRLTAALEAVRDRPDSSALLREIDVPVLVVTGDEDETIAPSESEAMAAALPQARLVHIPGAGHLAPLERPDELNRVLLSFLAELSG